MMAKAAHKIMILGAIGVGKTSIANRLVFERFDRSYKATIGVDVYSKSITLPDAADAIPIVIWDTDGDFGLTIFRTVYLKGASGALIVADATRSVSVDHLSRLIEGMREALPGRPCVAVLNKSDLKTLPDDEMRRIGQNADHVLTTSAMTGEGVFEAFCELVRIIERRSL